MKSWTTRTRSTALAVFAAASALIGSSSAGAVPAAFTPAAYSRAVTGVCAHALLFEGTHAIGTREGALEVADDIRASSRRRLALVAALSTPSGRDTPGCPLARSRTASRRHVCDQLRRHLRPHRSAVDARTGCRSTGTSRDTRTRSRRTPSGRRPPRATAPSPRLHRRLSNGSRQQPRGSPSFMPSWQERPRSPRDHRPQQKRRSNEATRIPVAPSLCQVSEAA